MKRVCMEALTELICESCQTCIYSCDVNRDVRMFNRLRVEKWRLECDLIILAALVEFRPMLPAVPERTDDLDLLAQFSSYRLRPRLPEPALDMCLDLCAKPQNESSSRLRGEIPGDIGKVCRGTCKGNGYPGPEV